MLTFLLYLRLPAAKRVFYLLLPCLLVGFSATAQSRVSGTVRSADAGTGIEYATVTLHRAADSAMVKTEFSDAQGAFRFEQAAQGRYLVSAAQVGFVRTWSGPFEVTTENYTLPALVLKSSQATALKEVTVIGQKPLYERLADRTVVNVEGSTLAAGNTTLDVLNRAPGVTVDGSDNLALRGRQGVLVLIDGKRQPMTGTELADYLRALPADQLKSIELITNPPAKYDAQGGAGIIAINLKKDQRQGTNGSVNASYGRSQYDKFTGGFSLNSRRKSLNTFGSYTYSDREGLGKLDIYRDFFDNSTGSQVLIGSSDQQNSSISQSKTHSGRMGFDYNFSERTVVGAAFSGLSNKGPGLARNQTTLFDGTGTIADVYNANTNRDFRSANGTANLNFKHTFADSANSGELTADVDYARYTLDRLQEQRTEYLLQERTSNLLVGDQEGDLAIMSAKADYIQPLPRKTRLEAGAKISRVTSDNDVVFRNTEGSLTTIDLNRTNRFKYEENIGAAYLNLNRTLAKTTLQAGLRVEQTKAIGRQVVGDSSFRRNYAQLFPSAAIKRTLNDKNEVNLTLSRRINRPSYGQLNPFRIIINPTTSGAGNPNLLPETSYNVELSHTFKQKFTSTLSYSRTDKPIIGVVQPETDSTVISTGVNLSRQDYYALTLTAPLEVKKWWQIYNNAVFYYSRFIGDLAGTSLDKGRPAFNITSNSTFTFDKGWGAELNTRFQSGEQYGFLRVKPNGQVSLGVQKSVWDRKGNIKLNVTDLFYTNRVRAVSAYDNYVERFYQRQDSRVATLSFTYRFGNDKLAPTRRRQGGAEDEKRRAGGS
ncbi:TonB-dependent receptor [Hymenobacter sp. BT188]|uniref:TonB-dependent receptor n=1 Tax=Hymenobacter sp. BT188 TaxID=2763504 RepID=UPI001650FB36|nr:TonB-dependent receptor [Hymenobacter sp. BT188]MBC6606979.1 TonB-dependent receptor [Hymenobacter sp. BT188]